MMDIKESLLLWFTSFFDKKSKGGGVNILLESNEELANELHKPIIKKFKKRTVYSLFKDNIQGADLADMQLISKFNKVFRFLLCVIGIFSKFALVVPLKDKKGFSIVNALMLFKKYQISRDVNQTKYGLIKEVNFTIILLKNG